MISRFWSQDNKQSGGVELVFPPPQVTKTPPAANTITAPNAILVALSSSLQSLSNFQLSNGINLCIRLTLHQKNIPVPPLGQGSRLRSSLTGGKVPDLTQLPPRGLLSPAAPRSDTPRRVPEARCVSVGRRPEAGPGPGACCCNPRCTREICLSSLLFLPLVLAFTFLAVGCAFPLPTGLRSRVLGGRCKPRDSLPRGVVALNLFGSV